MRSGWGEQDKYLHFEAGPFGIGHQHEDKLTVFIWALGRTLLTEGGTFSYDQSKWRRHVLGTWSHNTIIVDGQEQNRRNLKETYETKTPCDNLWVSTPQFDAADGIYDNGYGPKHDQLVHKVLLSDFAEETLPEVGGTVNLVAPDGDTLPGRIVAIEGDYVTLDFNHPLAGETLVFQIELVEIVSE